MAVSELIQKIDQAFSRMTFEKPLEKIRDDLKEETAKGFEQETDPQRNRWKELSPVTIQLKRKRAKRKGRKSRDKILQDSEDLRRSLDDRNQDRPTATTLEYGTDVPYGKFHISGTRRMPKREFLGVNDEMADKMAETIADHVEKEILDAIDVT